MERSQEQDTLAALEEAEVEEYRKAVEAPRAHPSSYPRLSAHTISPAVHFSSQAALRDAEMRSDPSRQTMSIRRGDGGADDPFKVAKPEPKEMKEQNEPAKFEHGSTQGLSAALNAGLLEDVA